MRGFDIFELNHRFYVRKMSLVCDSCLCDVTVKINEPLIKWFVIKLYSIYMTF